MTSENTPKTEAAPAAQAGAPWTPQIILPPVLRAEGTFAAQLYRIDKLSLGATSCLLTFAQILPPRRPVGAVVVEMSVEHLRMFLATFSKEAMAQLRLAPVASVETRISDDELACIPPERVLCTRATYIRSLAGPVGAQLDFLGILPQAVQYCASEKQNIELQPTITVVIAPESFHGFMRTIFDIVEEASSAPATGPRPSGATE